MPEYVRKGDCSYCGAANVLNLRGVKNGLIICEACGAKMSVGDFDKTSEMAPASPAPSCESRPPRSGKGDNRDREQRPAASRTRPNSMGLLALAGRALDKLDDLEDHWEDRWEGRWKKRRKKEGLFSRLADIADDIFDD